MVAYESPFDAVIYKKYLSQISQIILNQRGFFFSLMFADFADYFESARKKSPYNKLICEISEISEKKSLEGHINLRDPL
jgi:hypothetical protein